MSLFQPRKSIKKSSSLVFLSTLIFSVFFLNFPLKASAVVQDVQYTITDNGGPIVGYYNVKDSGNKVFNWNVDVTHNGPGGMHVVTIGAYDEQAGSAATTKHPFGITPSGKTAYSNPPETGSFSFSYDTARDSRLGQCGRVQIDGSFINETSPTYDDTNLFFAMVIDYGVDCPPANTAPTLTLVGSNPVTIVSGNTYVDAGATANDNEDGNITSSIVRTGTVNTSVVGTYTLTYNVSDSQGLAATPITRTVNVIAANQKPVITLVGVNPINIVQGSSYVDAGATALDQEDGNITVNILRTGTVNTSVVGTYTLTYNVSDSKGLAATTVTRTVNVTALPVNNKPVITLVGSNPLSIVAGSLYVESGATANDIEDGNISSNIVISGAVNTAIAGTYTVTYNVSDSQGLAADTVTRTVNVTPANQKPVITLIGSNPTSVTVGNIYSDAGATALDPEDGDITLNIHVTSTVNTAIAGTYTVTYNVSDSQGLAAFAVTRTVNVVAENHKPVITLLGSNPFNLIIGDLYNDAGATALDPEDGDITSNMATTSTINPLVVGSYLMTYNVSDSQGLAATPVTRVVDVYPTASNQCVIPDSLGDATVETFGVSEEPTFANIVSDAGVKVSSQRQYQTWHTNEASTTVTVTFLNGYTLAGDVFGYYKKGDVNSFVPLFTVGSGVNNTYPNIAVATPGHTYVIDVPAGDIAFAIHSSVSNGIFRTTENSLNTASGDYAVVYDVATTSAQNFGKYVIGFEDLDVTGHDHDYNDVVVMVEVNSCHTPVVNNRPVITLAGSNPATVNVGETYIDPSATALDIEDGDITSHIQVTSTVNTAVAGTYTVTYNVVDSKGLAAVPVSRTVNVLETGTGNPKGQITVCLMIADNQNQIATTSFGLPTGVFAMNLATTTDIASTLMQSNTWNTSTFAPNSKLILNENDANCITYSNLDLGTYYYSTASVTGSLWNTPKYTDKHNQTLNNVFDFFAYSPELFNADPSDDSSRNPNSDGQIILDSSNTNQSVNVYITYNPAPQCLLPEITSQLMASVTVNTPFTYTLTASSTSDILDVATSTLPAGLSYATSTHLISGNPTETGVFNIALSAANGCATTTGVLLLTVNPPAPAPSANLSISKVADKTTANVGDAITYTITVANTGSSTATNVIATESFPSLLNFVSATPTVGSYSTTTGVWTIGNLANGSTTTLTLVGTVKAGSENQTITNSVTVTSDTTDPDTANNTSTTTTTVNPAPCTSCGGGGGGTTPTVNLSVVKTADKTTANVGDTVIYTLNVSNSGPDNATNVSLTETFPSLLTLVSATSTVGSYSTTTGVWTIGNLANGSTTTLTLVATIKSGSEGQKITNTVTVRADQTDNNGSNNTSSVDLNVNTPPCTTCGGGGGGGSVPPANGPIVGSLANGPIVSQPQVQGEAAACYYLRDYLRRDFNNDPIEVKKLQVFLRELEGFNVETTGIYDEQTIVSLNAFQWRYKDDILTPWGHTAPTSYTYILTKKKVNEIYCKTAFPVTAQQQEEIDNYRNFLLSLRNEGISLPNTNTNGSIGTTTNTIISTSSESQVGSIDTSSGLTTLAGFSSTTQKITDNVADSVLYAGKRVANLALAFVAWPFGSLRGWFTKQCGVGSNIFAWISLLLVLIVMILSYVLYKQYKKQKTIDKINQEIDLN